MSIDIWLNIIGGIILVIVPVIFGLLKLIYSSLHKRADQLEERMSRIEDRMEERFRSTGHSIREIWSQLQGITELFIHKDRDNK